MEGAPNFPVFGEKLVLHQAPSNRLLVQKVLQVGIVETAVLARLELVEVRIGQVKVHGNARDELERGMFESQGIKSKSGLQ